MALAADTDDVPTRPGSSTPVTPSPLNTREELQEAISAYEHGGYLAAAARLSALLYPLKLTDRRDIVTAKAHLGMCYYVIGRRDNAAVEFRAVFKIDPTWKPDPLKVPPELVTFIERLRPAVARTAPVPGLGEDFQRPLQPIERFTYTQLLPFGVPQLLHQDYGRGLALAGIEATCLAANVSSYWYLRINAQSVPTDEAAYERLQVARGINYSSLGLLVVTAVLGTGDALVRYRNIPKVPELELKLMPGGGPGPMGLHGNPGGPGLAGLQLSGRF